MILADPNSLITVMISSRRSSGFKGGIILMSTLSLAFPGMMYRSLSPPSIQRGTTSEGPKSLWAFPRNGSDLRELISFMDFSMAFSPISEHEPCASFPAISTSSSIAPICAVAIRSPVGSSTMAIEIHGGIQRPSPPAPPSSSSTVKARATGASVLSMATTSADIWPFASRTPRPLRYGPSSVSSYDWAGMVSEWVQMRSGVRPLHAIKFGLDGRISWRKHSSPSPSRSPFRYSWNGPSSPVGLGISIREPSSSLILFSHAIAF